MNIGERLRKIRTTLGLSQADAATKYGLTLSSYKKYETGIVEPGAAALTSIVSSGVNPHWLLIGEGEMFLADSPKPKEPEPLPSALNVEILTYVIEGIETALDERDLMLDAARKAALIQLIYDYCVETGSSKPGTVERFLKLVA